MLDNSHVSRLGQPEVNQQMIDSGVAAIQVSGELDLATVGKLETKVEQALRQGSAPLLIDFTGCTFIDSSVLSALVDLRRRLGHSVRPRFAVVAQHQPLRVLHLTGLDREMPVFAGSADALRALELAGAAES